MTNTASRARVSLCFVLVIYSLAAVLSSLPRLLFVSIASLVLTLVAGLVFNLPKRLSVLIYAINSALRTPAATASPAAPSCGFCGKLNTEVKALIQAPVDYICEECVAICASIVQRNGVAAPKEEARCKCGLEKDDPIHSFSTEWQQMHTFIPATTPSPDAARHYFCSCGGALTAEEYIEHYFEKGHDHGEPHLLAKAAAEEIVKRWMWHTPEHDQERARINITEIIRSHCFPTGGESRKD